MAQSPLVTPTPSSSPPTSVPPLRPHDNTWLDDEIPSFIPASHTTICQILPEPSPQDVTSISNKFFLCTPSNYVNADRPNPSVAQRSQVFRLRMRHYSTNRSTGRATTKEIKYTAPSTTSRFTCAAALPTSTTPKMTQHVVTPDLAEPEHLELNACSFAKDKNENHSSSVDVADLLLPKLETPKSSDMLLPRGGSWSGNSQVK